MRAPNVCNKRTFNDKAENFASQNDIVAQKRLEHESCQTCSFFKTVGLFTRCIARKNIEIKSYNICHRHVKRTALLPVGSR